MNTIDITEVWEQSLVLLSKVEETKSPLARVYLDYLIPKTIDDQQIIFSVRLVQAKVWIEERYLSFIKDSITAVLGSPRDIILTIDDSAGTVVTKSYTSSQHATQQTELPTAAQTSQPMRNSTQQFQSISNVSPSSAHTFNETSLSAGQQASLSSVAVAVNPSHSSTENYGTSPVHSDNSGRSTGVSAVFAPDIQKTKPFEAEPDARFSFSNYIMGDSNEFAYKASVRVAENPGLYFNPLFIYGRSGLGKTHLLVSIKNYINAYLSEKRVVYAPTSELVNDFTNAMAGDRDLTSFKRKYHTCDVLLIDDVQNLEGKEGTTDALFEIFNMFIESKKQIVLSADRSPIEIKIDERFTSRFAQGITADIQPPNYEMKTAILRNYKRYYCNFLKIPEVDFTDDAVQKIVELSGSNIRELEGAVSNLIAYVSCRQDALESFPISYKDVETVLGNSSFHKNTHRIDSDMVMRAVESYFKISHAELLSDKRSKNISYPRQVAMYLIRRYTDMSYPEIGDSFNKDHTTVMYADRNIQAKMVEEINVKVEVERIAEMLTGQ